MGEREMLLTLAAMVFFSLTSLSANRFYLTNNQLVMESEFTYYAISLAQKIIEEAKTRAFDVAVESGPAMNPPNDFTYPCSHRNDEYYPYFSDVDDYDGLVLDVNTPRTNYRVTVKVGYVEENNPGIFVNYKTFYKKMTVNVSSNYLKSNVTLNHVFSYYEFY